MKMTKNNRKLYDDFTKEDLELMSINEVLKPDDVKAESKDLVSNRIYYKKGNLELKEIYNGVAWTDLLNEYYYRYDVEVYGDCRACVFDHCVCLSGLQGCAYPV